MKKENLKQTINECVNKILEKHPDANYKTIREEFLSTAKNLIETHKLQSGTPVQELKEEEFQWKVHMLFKKMGANLTLAKTGVKHDGIIRFMLGETEVKLVLEIKSHATKGAKTKDLRQLDHWVFSLSGEEKARNKKILGGHAGWVMGQPDVGLGHFEHPDPHKGVFIINHDFLRPFNNRCSPFGHNEVEFAKSRNFCLIDFQTLLSLYDKVQRHEYSLEEILTAIYKSVGIFHLDDKNNKPHGQ